ncbi:chorismate-binding protein, partial [Sinorhizobium meliloti]
MIEHAPYVLFRDDSENRTTVFAEPLRVITARTRAEFHRGLGEIDAAHRAGKWIAGFMAYEAGHLFEKKLASFAPENRETPLMSFGVFDAPAEDHPLAVPQRRTENEPFLLEPRAGWDFPAYRQRFEKLHRHLRQGDCYQANLTMPIHARWSGDPLAAFWSLIERQPVKYGALVALDGPVLLSRSPELFFRVDADGWIETHPMKGTARRGSSPDEDDAIIAA